MRSINIQTPAYVKKVNLKSKKDGEDEYPIAEVTLEINLRYREELGTQLALLLSKMASLSLVRENPQISMFDNVEDETEETPQDVEETA